MNKLLLITLLLVAGCGSSSPSGSSGSIDRTAVKSIGIREFVARDQRSLSEKYPNVNLYKGSDSLYHYIRVREPMDLAKAPEEYRILRAELEVVDEFAITQDSSHWRQVVILTAPGKPTQAVPADEAIYHQLRDIGPRPSTKPVDQGDLRL